MISLLSPLALDIGWGTTLAIKTIVILMIIPAGALILGYVFLLKVMSHMQSRLGPMDPGGFHGWYQLIGDGIKFLQKEDVMPTKADKRVFAAAPAVVVLSTFLVFAVIPMGPDLVVKDLDIGVFYALAVSIGTVIGWTLIFTTSLSPELVNVISSAVYGLMLPFIAISACLLYFDRVEREREDGRLAGPRKLRRRRVLVGIRVADSAAAALGRRRRMRPAWILGGTLTALTLLLFPQRPLAHLIQGTPGVPAYDQQAALGAWLRERTAPGDYVFTWGWAGLVQTTSERRSPSRYFNRHFLRGPEVTREVQDDLRRRPPRMYAVHTRPPCWLARHIAECCQLVHVVVRPNYEIYEAPPRDGRPALPPFAGPRPFKPWVDVEAARAQACPEEAQRR